ncbi:MAG: Hsp20/alpha crystallin family protein [Halobacteriales archaeon]|nr:Hsp20/alpha crystallin family protein [Halobacteriales archaeon]
MSSRINPFYELERVFDRLNRQVQDASWWRDEGEDSWFGEHEMALDILDEGDEFVITVDVPGYDRNEIDVRVSDRTLWIEAERREEAEEGDDKYLRRERRRVSQSRSIPLPSDVTAEGVTARLKNGILTITVPKAEPTEEARRIEIESD